MMTAGRPSSAQLLSPPRRAGSASSSRTILTTCWAGVRLSSTSAPSGAFAHPLDERLDHPQVHVGLEQRQPDLAQRRLERLGGDPALALELAEDVLELALETVEHGRTSLLTGGRNGSTA